MTAIILTYNEGLALWNVLIWCWSVREAETRKEKGWEWNLFLILVYNKEENNSYLKTVIVQFKIFSPIQEVCVSVCRGHLLGSPELGTPPDT